MRRLRSFLTAIFMVMLLGSAHQLKASPIRHLNVSLWSEYKKVEFQGLSQEEKTQKLQTIFRDKATFAKVHNARRVIVRILDPTNFDFFNPENFDSARDDNFYYWALQLNTGAEIEALFDGSEFHLSPQSFSERLYSAYEYYFKSDQLLGTFCNLNDKLEWVSIVNDTFAPKNRGVILIKGITIDPKGESEAVCQNIINTLDQYKSNANELLPNNNYFHIRRAMLLDIDQKDLALANLAVFPMITDLRGEKPNSIGVELLEEHPSQGPHFLAPSWRNKQNHALLETVYIRMYDPRLVDCVYQHGSALPDPAVSNPVAVKSLAQNLGDVFRGAPFKQGPGYITNLKGTSEISGLYTFFKTGGNQNQEGQFVDGSYIKVFIQNPNGTYRDVTKVVSGDPKNNREMKITSSFSTTQDIEDSEYYLAPIPVNWTFPRISARVHNAIYYVFSTDFDPKQGRYFGNWSVDNFVKFFYHPQYASGFLTQKFFSAFTVLSCWAPKNNIVLYDFTTIPNGNPYPECDWGLGNQAH